MDKSKQTYNIPVRWESVKVFKVDADNLDEAVKKAWEIFMGLPDADYIPDTGAVDEHVFDEYPDEEISDQTISNCF
jgi:hypothetical protein